MVKQIRNGETIRLEAIPVLGYAEFMGEVGRLLMMQSSHCINYYAVPMNGKLRYFCLIANDKQNNIAVLSHETPNSPDVVRPSLSQKHFALHVFEREIHENFGIQFDGHPWMKPIRYSFDRADKQSVMDNYPFFKIDSEELHEVGVGPIHAGIIEPGHFRFICNGEKVLHIEIHLGYQHRGVESLFVSKKSPLQQSLLAENIAGDTTVAHTMAYAGIVESLSGYLVLDKLAIERVIAQELERIAIHIADTSALCTDVAYQFGQVVNEALRTIVINTTQLWCGNRFGKGLIRPCGSNYPLSTETALKILENISEVENRYNQIAERIFSLPSVLDRFEGIGNVSPDQARLIGAVGMAARSTGIVRDSRASHPYGFYQRLKHQPVTVDNGDVWARLMLRRLEVQQSVDLIKKLIEKHQSLSIYQAGVNYQPDLAPSSLAVSVTEGWRGEICHSAITNERGEIVHYKVKDPSLHNWMALALAVRNQEISDFPICNKSFNLSYCGNDL